MSTYDQAIDHSRQCVVAVFAFILICHLFRSFQGYSPNLTEESDDADYDDRRGSNQIPDESFQKHGPEMTEKTGPSPEICQRLG